MGLTLLTALESLSLSSTRVDLSGEALWSLTQLTQLELTDCELRSLPEGVSSLVRLEQLMLEVRERRASRDGGGNLEGGFRAQGGRGGGEENERTGLGRREGGAN